MPKQGIGAMQGTDNGAMGPGSMGTMSKMGGMMGIGGQMNGMAMDLNDYDRTLSLLLIKVLANIETCLFIFLVSR